MSPGGPPCCMMLPAGSPLTVTSSSSSCRTAQCLHAHCPCRTAFLAPGTQKCSDRPWEGGWAGIVSWRSGSEAEAPRAALGCRQRWANIRLERATCMYRTVRVQRSTVGHPCNRRKLSYYNVRSGTSNWGPHTVPYDTRPAFIVRMAPSMGRSHGPRHRYCTKKCC